MMDKSIKKCPKCGCICSSEQEYCLNGHRLEVLPEFLNNASKDFFTDFFSFINPKSNKGNK